jgi:hypothetical protein
MNQDPGRPAIVELIDQLRSSDEEESKRAEESLRALGPTAIPHLVECMRSATGEICVGAACALGRLGIGSEEVVAALIEALDSSEEALQEAAAFALGGLSPVPVEALPKLIELLRHPTWEPIWAVFRTLEKFGPAAAPAAAAVAATIGSRCEHGPYVLASIGTRDSVLRLVDAIATYGGGDRKDFESAVDALCRVADVARPIIEEEFRSAGPGEYSTLLRGLVEIVDGAELVRYVLHVIRHGDPHSRAYAIRLAERFSLRCHFCKAEGAIEELVKAMTDPDIWVCVAALSTFAAYHSDDNDLGRVYGDRLLPALKHAIENLKDSWHLESLRKLAVKLGFPTLASESAP